MTAKLIQTGEHTFHPKAPEYRRGAGRWEHETADRNGRVYLIRWDPETYLYEVLEWLGRPKPSLHEEKRLHTASTMRAALGWVADSPAAASPLETTTQEHTMTKRLQALRAFLKASGYGRGYRYSAYPCFDADGGDNCAMDREQHSSEAIAREANAGERWYIDVWATLGTESDCVIDHLTFTFPEAS